MYLNLSTIIFLLKESERKKMTIPIPIDTHEHSKTFVLNSLLSLF